MYGGNVIIIGSGNHHNALGVVRALGEGEINFDLITYGSLSKHYISFSKYVKRHRAFVNPEEIIDYLLKEPLYDNSKSIIISCADIITELLNINHSALSERFIIPGFNNSENVKTLMDKSTMIKIAEGCGIKAPTIWSLPSDIASVKFPCITKGYLSTIGGKDTIQIIKSSKELQIFMENFPEDIFAQEYVNKLEEVQFIGVSLGSGNDVIIPGMTKILRSQPNTNTGLLEYGPIDVFYQNIVEKSKSFIKECGYSGLFSIEFIRDKYDNIYFLEVNFRNDGNAWCVTKSGVSLPVIWVKSCRGDNYSDEIRIPNRIIMMPEFQDFKLVLQRKVSLWRWLKDWKRTDYFMEFDKMDKKPFFRYILDKVM